MNKIIALVAVMLILSGCQYLKPALAPSTDCATGIVDKTDVPVTGAVIKATPQESIRDGVPVKTVKEGELVSFPNLKATDADGDKVTYSFTSPLNAKGEWQTKAGDAGEYKVVITASDGKTSTKQELIIKVIAANKAPTIELADAKVKEGEQVTLAPKVSDADGDKLTTTYSGWMTTNTKKTTFDDAGSHQVTVTVDDAKGGKTAKTINVIVENVNRAPQILQMQDIATQEGKKIELLPKATDADSDKLTFTYSAPFDAMGVWQTKVGDEGTKKVTVTVDDGKGGKASTTFTIAIESVNKAPVITGPASLSIKEGDVIDLTKSFTVTDEDKDAITVTYSGWMTSAVKTTGYSDQGSHEVTITATDGKHDPVKKLVTIIVADANRPPSFDSGSFN
jgi:VCBS repeat-containing protein